MAVFNRETTTRGIFTGIRFNKHGMHKRWFTRINKFEI